MVRDLRRTRLALGDGTKTMYASETEPIIKMAKKLVAARDLAAGHTLTADDVALKSPGDGLPPYELDRLVGRTLRHPVRRDTSLIRAARGAAAGRRPRARLAWLTLTGRWR